MAKPRIRWLKAKKKHRCKTCGAKIEKGEEYRRIDLPNYRGQVRFDKECDICATLELKELRDEWEDGRGN